jgi:hypothetical protein
MSSSRGGRRGWLLKVEVGSVVVLEFCGSLGLVESVVVGCGTVWVTGRVGVDAMGSVQTELCSTAVRRWLCNVTIMV